MKIVKVSAIPMSAPVPEEKRHRTDLGTKVKSDATLIRVETDNGLTGIGAALGTPPAYWVRSMRRRDALGWQPLPPLGGSYSFNLQSANGAASF